MNKNMQDNRQKWWFLFSIGLILVVLSFIVIAMLPDGKMGSDWFVHADLYWLIVGILHCIFVILTASCWLKLNCNVNPLKFCSPNVFIIIILAMIWFFFVVPKIKSGYVRNKAIVVDVRKAIVE